VIYIFLAGVGIGVPVILFLIVFRGYWLNLIVADEKFKHRYGLLFEVYTPRFFYWDVLVLVRRVVLIFVVTIGSDRKDLRLTFATVVNILLLLVQMAAKPFSNDGDNYQEMLLLVVLSIVTTVLISAPAPLDDTYQACLAILVLVTLLYLAIQIIRNRTQKAIEIYRSRKATEASEKGGIELGVINKPPSTLPPELTSSSSPLPTTAVLSSPDESTSNPDISISSPSDAPVVTKEQPSSLSPSSTSPNLSTDLPPLDISSLSLAPTQSSSTDSSSV
jgi:hypothetical protein